MIIKVKIIKIKILVQSNVNFGYTVHAELWELRII